MELPTGHTVFQNSWVVDDIEAAAMKWVNTFKLGPFFIGEFGPDSLTDITYRGQPGEMHMLVALAQAGPLQIELIQPLTEERIAYRDTVQKGESKFHHVCVWSNDLDADVAFYNDKGCETANTGTVIATGARFAYVDTHEQLNCMLEILEHNAGIEEMFKMIADTCANWDGRESIRSF